VPHHKHDRIARLIAIAMIYRNIKGRGSFYES